MNIAITGGTGVLGSAVAAELRRRGHEVRLLSRTPPAGALDAGTTHHRLDLVAASDRDLDAVLLGVDVVVDAHNVVKRRSVEALMVHGSRRLSEAAARVGVRHHVLASIVGIDGRKFGYYQAKVAQEKAVLGGPVPATAVRITQFHTLLDWAIATAAGKMRLRPTGKLRFQPIDVADAARAMVDAAEDEPRGTRCDVAGPQVLTLSELSSSWQRARGRRGLLPVRLPAIGTDGRGLAAGALTNPEAAVSGGRTWAQFLAGVPVANVAEPLRR